MSYSCSVGKTGKGGSVASSAYRSAELLYDERTGRTWTTGASAAWWPRSSRRRRAATGRGTATRCGTRRRRRSGGSARRWRGVAAGVAGGAVGRAPRGAGAGLRGGAGGALRGGGGRGGAPASATGDQRNHHAHILTTSRVVEPEGLGKKTRVLDDLKTGPVEITAMRAVWAGLCNEALERAGSAERVDHRSLKAQRAEALAAGTWCGRPS